MTLSPLPHYTRTAERAAGEVIASYSTSFGLATTLLGQRHRQHVRNIYALVRVADELVDGMTAEAGLTPSEQSDMLARLIEETHLALRLGCSSNLIVHAFAQTARASGIDETLTQPFFDSMQTDLAPGVPLHGDALTDGAGHTALSAGSPARAPVGFDRDAHARYVYGSAEVVGLMCLRVFLRDRAADAGELATLEHGARQLGAAFQNINFLRDLADDVDRLGRSYLGPGERIDDVDRLNWLAAIRRQLADASAAIPLLPRDARAAVRSALALFAALADRIEATPIEELYRRRVRVSNPAKAALALRALVTTAAERSE